MAAQLAAIRVAQSGLHLELRHRPPAEMDRGRFELWTRKLAVDAEGGDAGGVRGDLATLEWIRDRIARTLPKVDPCAHRPSPVRAADEGTDGELRGAGAEAERLRRTLARRSQKLRAV